jgi:hypothetical protein
MASCVTARANSLWFGADDSFLRVAKGHGANDYMELFTGDGSWARNVDVILISQQFALLGSAADVSAVVRFANTHHIQLAMSALMLVSPDGSCGTRVEGYAGPRGVENSATRIKKLGGTLTYIEMDEPLFYGSLFTGPRACNTPVARIAAEVARRVKSIRQVLPNVRIGDDEPVGSLPGFPLPQTLAEWFDAYRAATGEPLFYFHADVGWHRENWPEQLPAVARLVRSRGIRFGIFYNGSPTDTDDLAWSTHALQRAKEIQTRLGVIPDDAVIESWMVYPERMLPPTEPGTLTWLLRAYETINR